MAVTNLLMCSAANKKFGQKHRKPPFFHSTAFDGKIKRHEQIFLGIHTLSLKSSTSSCKQIVENVPKNGQQKTTINVAEIKCAQKANDLTFGSITSITLLYLGLDFSTCIGKGFHNLTLYRPVRYLRCVNILLNYGMSTLLPFSSIVEKKLDAFLFSPFTDATFKRFSGVIFCES